MEDIARKANQDQRELVEQYEQASQKPPKSGFYKKPYRKVRLFVWLSGGSLTNFPRGFRGCFGSRTGTWSAVLADVP